MTRWRAPTSPSSQTRPYPALSGGQRRRVLVARALASNPELLILDEPTANMDAESEARLFATLERLKGNTTIMIVTHDTGFVTRAHRLGPLRRRPEHERRRAFGRQARHGAFRGRATRALRRQGEQGSP